MDYGKLWPMCYIYVDLIFTFNSYECSYFVFDLIVLKLVSIQRLRRLIFFISIKEGVGISKKFTVQAIKLKKYVLQHKR